MDNISHTKSDTFLKDISFKDGDGTPIDITGSDIKFTIKTNIEDETPLLQESFTITDAKNGLANIQISSASMGLDVGSYYFDIQWIDGTGIVRTVMKGVFIITYEITT